MEIRMRLLKPANAHVLMVSFLLGGVGALLIGLQQSLKSAEDAIRPALKVAVFIQSTVSDADAATWAHSLLSLDPELESADFISRQDALQKAQENPALVKSLVLLRENPFPASVILRYKDMAWLDRPEPAMSLKTQTQVQEIRWDPEARSVFRSLRQWRLWLVRLTAFAIMMLTVWCFFGVYRFLAMKAPFAELFSQLGIGLIGGSLAVMTWGFALRGVGSDAALYRPETVSFWPLATAAMAALATFGWEAKHEN
jgi:cell division protein FtsX